jgi:hypothetical protein
LAQAAAEVDKAIDNVRTAQQSGDFAKYGEALQALDAAMAKFQAAQAAVAGAATPDPSGSASPSAPASTGASAPASPSASPGG